MITFRIAGIAATMESLIFVTLTSLLCLGRNVMASTTEVTPSNATTPEPEWGIRLTHKASSTSSITVEWHYPRIYSDHIDEYLIRTRKNNSDSVLHSPVIAGNETTYEVENLVKNSRYQICLFVKVAEGYELEGETEACQEFKTLALIRRDSLIAIILALGIIVLLVLIGIICWQCAKCRMEKAQEGSVGEHEELLDKQDTNGGNLLAPPPQGRPRSSIEEELPYIPYITPPLEELEREKRASAANNV